VHGAELIVRREDRRRRVVVQQRVALIHDVIGESVDRQDAKGRHRPSHPLEQRGARLVPGALGADDERHPLRIDSGLDQSGEPLAQGGRLARPGRSGNQEGARPMVEHACLLGIR
jgi:hypothetical protein